MLQEPFPDLDDGEEPDGFMPPAGEDGPGHQGLFLSLPAEQFDPDQFAQSGPAKDMPPGALMATILNLVSGQDGSGFAGLSEDRLVGVISAGRRMESWSAWFSMAATGEFSRRHEGKGGRHEFAADELADELHLTWNSAAGQMDYARTVAERLPLCFAALRAGLIHPVDLRIIEDETRILSAADAAKADAILAGMAGTMTWGKLRHAAHRLVWDLDPEAVRKRQEAFQRETQVRKFREDSGNAGLIARELAADDAPDGGGPGGSRPGGSGGGRGGSGPGGSGAGPSGGSGSGRTAGWEAGPKLAALINITVPWTVLQRKSETPADVAGFGLVSADDARDLIAAAARDPRTRWCVTGLHPDGTAAAHGCAAGRHLPPAAITSTSTGTGPGPPQQYLNVTMTPIARGHCDHAHAEARYKPSRALQHLIRVRNGRCTAPGCSRPAGRCDLDHTIAWDQGGMTCECDLAPLWLSRPGARFRDYSRPVSNK